MENLLLYNTRLFRSPGVDFYGKAKHATTTTQYKAAQQEKNQQHKVEETGKYSCARSPLLLSSVLGPALHAVPARIHTGLICSEYFSFRFATLEAGAHSGAC